MDDAMFDADAQWRMQQKEIERLRIEVERLKNTIALNRSQGSEDFQVLEARLAAERQRARLPEELEMWARKLIAFDDGCDEAGEQNMTSIYEPLQLLRDILTWHDRWADE